MVADDEGSVNLSHRLLSSRILMLGQEVNDEIANQLCAQLLVLEADDDDAEIWLYINSPGGSLTAGMAIYDTMQFVKPPVATVAMGFAASMGQFLLCAGAAGRRFALPNARIVMHQPSAGLQGVASDIAIQAEAFRHSKTVMAHLIAEHTGRTVAEVQADGDRDHWYTAQQAKAYGFVDHVLKSRSDLKPLAEFS
jgi:ATP-dependent Clp protease, protease subunit